MSGVFQHLQAVDERDRLLSGVLESPPKGAAGLKLAPGKALGTAAPGTSVRFPPPASVLPSRGAVEGTCLEANTAFLSDV